MSDEEIRKDREERITNCKKELEAVLGKYHMALVAEDQWSPNTKVTVQIQFADLKKYDNAILAQEDRPIIKKSKKR